MRRLPVDVEIGSMARDDLLKLREDITAINIRLGNEVRSSTPSRAHPPVNREVFSLDRDDLQRRMQERLSRSLAGLSLTHGSGSAGPSNSSLDGCSIEKVSCDVCTKELVQRHAGPRSACVPSLDVPVVMLPRLGESDGISEIDDPASSGSVSKRLARESRRRAHKKIDGRRARSAHTAGSIRYRDEAHRLTEVLHTVMEQLDSDDESYHLAFMAASKPLADSDDEMWLL